MEHTHLDLYQLAFEHSFAQCIYTHLEKPGSFVRILFIDFSSAFIIEVCLLCGVIVWYIQPHHMARKLLKLDVNPRLIL